MSTVPTIATAATETLETILATDPTTVLDPTAATEAVLDAESFKEILNGFDPASLLPELSDIFGSVAALCRVAVLIGPIVLLVLGLAYLFFSPKEANYYFGYRCYFGMGSVQAWRFTQRLAGMLLGGLGLLLLLIAWISGNGFANLEPMDAVWKAFDLLLWQAILALIANIAITVTAAIKFDRKGEYRKK
ncbi:MAG: SdpI family protein [Oscillospiraceae bacterium]|nr:SdpI family protein [Oscillospiraceae bacterium]MBQ8835769.1 SdpI family protein [Oscillospiraceae bacterium]